MMEERKEFSKPVSEGQELEVKIEAAGSKGDGIAKVEGFIIFVPGAKAGDTVKIRVNAVRRNFAFAEVIG
jgi:predicted RNA-binding protein with TRAM domain